MNTTKVYLLVLTLSIALAVACRSQNTAPAAGFNPEIQPLPAALTTYEPMVIPADNPMSPEKVALGRQLFFDERLSIDGSKSCYSCHVCEHGLTDGLPKAIGPGNKTLKRSSPTLWNIGYHKELYWDGRSASLEKQAMAAWTGANMGAKDKVNDIVATVNAVPGYKSQFQSVFGGAATADNMMQAISAYERTIVCGDTAFDKFQQGDAAALSDEAKRGWEIFRGKADCGKCHAGALLTDLQYHNVGVGMDAPEPDGGRKNFTKEDKDTGGFKTPSLRNVSRSAPYFHNGSKATLEEAVDFMLGGGQANKYLDTKNLQKKKLTAAERSDLLAFLKSLDCGGSLKEPKLP